jgi:hypothetical protein
MEFSFQIALASENDEVTTLTADAERWDSLMMTTTVQIADRVCWVLVSIPTGQDVPIFPAPAFCTTNS